MRLLGLFVGLLMLFAVSCHKQTRTPTCTLPPTPPSCDVSSGTCDYNVDGPLDIPIELTHGRNQNIHFHGTKDFAVNIVPDQSCFHSGCEQCPFQNGKCSSKKGNAANFGPVTTKDAKGDCQYKVNIDFNPTSADPVLIVH